MKNLAAAALILYPLLFLAFFLTSLCGCTGLPFTRGEASTGAATGPAYTPVIRQSGPAAQASDLATSAGWVCYYQDDLESARFRFNRALQLDPDNSLACWGLGAVYFRMGDSHLDEAVWLIEKAFTLDPLNPGIVADLAHVYADKAQSLPPAEREKRADYFDSANGLFLKASQLAPGNGYIYLQWAGACAYQEQYAAAWQMIHRARALGVPEEQIDPVFLKALGEKMPEPKQSGPGR
jgi:tetratricopeptide (TPR) repeat protein